MSQSSGCDVYLAHTYNDFQASDNSVVCAGVIFRHLDISSLLRMNPLCFTIFHTVCWTRIVSSYHE